MLVVGGKDESAGTVSVRTLTDDLGAVPRADSPRPRREGARRALRDGFGLIDGSFEHSLRSSAEDAEVRRHGGSSNGTRGDAGGRTPAAPRSPREPSSCDRGSGRGRWAAEQRG